MISPIERFPSDRHGKHKGKPSSGSETPGSLDLSGDEPLSRDVKRAKLAGRLRAIQPTLVISVGGSAGQIASRTKGLIQQQGTASHVRFLAFDTDETAQAGADGHPSFSDNEFKRVNPNRVHNVLDNPKQHSKIIQRFDLDQQRNESQHRMLIGANIEQAGQVRTFGNLSLLCDYSGVEYTIRQALAELTGIHAGLAKQLQADQRVVLRNKTTIYLLTSAAGGTGSSFHARDLANVERFDPRNECRSRSLRRDAIGF